MTEIAIEITVSVKYPVYLDTGLEIERNLGSINVGCENVFLR